MHSIAFVALSSLKIVQSEIKRSSQAWFSLLSYHLPLDYMGVLVKLRVGENTKDLGADALH